MDGSNPHRAVRRWIGLVGALVVGAVFVGIVWAQIPQDGVYTGCYLKSGGTLRVIDASQKCKSGETRITWNQAGQPGAQGQPGEKGEQGEPGPGAVMEHREFCGGQGCPLAMTITEPEQTVTILTLDRPNDGQPPWDQTIALASLEIENVGSGQDLPDEGAHMGCTLGQEDWNFWLPAEGEGGSTVTFVSPYVGTDDVTLTCNPGNAPPGYTFNIKITGVTLTLVPASYVNIVHPNT